MLGDRVRKARGTASFSMEQLAAKAGVSKETIRQIERNIRTPNVSILVEIAKALDIDPGDLLREEVA